jgi:hypothetical protein
MIKAIFQGAPLNVRANMMKYINLLPPEFQLESRVGWLETKRPSKITVAFLVIPPIIFFLIFGGVMVVKYNYKSRLKNMAAQEAPLRVTAKTKVTVMPSKPAIQPQVSAKQPPPLIKEQVVSPARDVSPRLATVKVQPSESNTAVKEAAGYTIRFEAFVDPSKAESLIQELKEQQLKPYQQVKQIFRKVNTVYVDQSSTMEEAMQLSNRLEADGFESFIKIRPQGAYGIGVKRFPSLIMARKLAESLKQLGYSAEVVPEQLPLTVYQVNLGHFAEYREAKLMQKKLAQERGYHHTSIVKE